jgi:hypothetical protein
MMLRTPSHAYLLQQVCKLWLADVGPDGNQQRRLSLPHGISQLWQQSEHVPAASQYDMVSETALCDDLSGQQAMPAASTGWPSQ